MATKTTEIVAQRTRHAKHFDTDEPDKFIAEIGTGPKHFRHRTTTEWTDMDQLLVDEGGGDFTILADDADFALQGGWLRISRLNRDQFNIRPDALYLVDTAATLIEKVSDASYAGGYTRTGNQVTLHSLFAGVDLEVAFSDDRLVKRWQIAAPLTLPDPVSLGMDPATTVLAFSWDIQTTLPIKDEAGTPITDGWSGSEALEVEGSDGQPLVWWRKPEGWDAFSTPISMAYGKFRQGGKRIDLAETVPYQEFVAQSNFPLTLDPSTDIKPTAGSDDGHLYYRTPDTYAGVSSSTNCSIGYEDGGATEYEYQMNWRFDLSSLSGSTCDSATLYTYIYATNNGGTANNVPLIVLTSDPFPLDWTDGPPPADWDTTGTTTATEDVCGWSTGWNTWTCTASHVEAKFGGWCPMRTGSTSVVGDNTGDGRAVYGRTKDYTTDTGLQPYLSITYSASATPGVTFNFDTDTVTIIGGSPP